MDEEYRAWAEAELQEEMSRGPVQERFFENGGTIASHTDVIDLSGLEKLNFHDQVVVSIDLDFFTSRPRFREDLIKILWWVSEIDHLLAVTVAISPVYLPEDKNWMYETLEILFSEALQHSEWAIEFEPFINRGRETSQKALEMEAFGMSVPRLDVTEAPESLIKLWKSNQDKISVHRETASWEALLNLR